MGRQLAKCRFSATRGLKGELLLVLGGANRLVGASSAATL